MGPRYRGHAAAAAVVFIAAVGWWLWPEGRRGVVVGAGFVLFVVGAARLLGATALRTTPKSPFDEAMARPGAIRRRPDDLLRVERLVGWRRYSPEDYLHRLQPVLRELLRARLMAARGTDIDRDPRSAADLPPALRAVASGRAPEESIDTRALERVVAEIEAIR